MGTYFKQQDLDRLRDLRATLLGMEDRSEGEAAPRYWQDRRDIELYDQIFAARIGWKWDAVLDEIEDRHGLPAPKTVVDWGTGTGIAARKVLGRMPGIESITLFDRDHAVLAFARRSVAEAFPAVQVIAVTEPPEDAADLALASHVLDELDEEGLGVLHGTIARAGHVLWVEPGSKRTSRELVRQRESLLQDFQVLGPCTHQASCGMLTPDHKRDWCHLFAKAPAEVHTTGEWSEIHRELRIDLRSLPYSFLALRRRDLGLADPKQEGARLLQRPRFQRGRVLLDLCDADGVRESQMLQRQDKAFFKDLKKSPSDFRFLKETDAGIEPV
ncbi:Mitochondrial small ribosomal subunit Rsm22 [Planctomycetes bacterium Poly30]|uniref:Mitochondrial small ribosomal subunit Rsm22 n=1 Tax=Saltatorellus ferox TaxID=2528018 RepID=A0A518ENP6_9BACT|nr:Mitochondrial small ribosomal subunit Rsm22 [Planctomycetes bacterium Poly30]